MSSICSALAEFFAACVVRMPLHMRVFLKFKLSCTIFAILGWKTVSSGNNSVGSSTILTPNHWHVLSF